MSKLTWIVTFAALVALPAVAETAIPDLRGTWKGESESIVMGPGNPIIPRHRPPDRATTASRSR